MKVYDTLIIGCGYFSVGYALATENCVICEESQICDTHFYLPLSSYKYREYLPKTKDGARLLEIFSELELIRGDMQNTNAFECGFCKFLLERPQEIMLKCRVISITEEQDGIYNATIQTNEGLTHLHAKNILTTTGKGGAQYFTVLFVTEDIASVSSQLTCAFRGSYVEKAFYDGRCALHIPADGCNENDIKLAVYQKWRDLPIDARIVYMAPVFSRRGEDGRLCDDSYDNPIEAFEAGYFYGEKAKNDTFNT